MVGYAAAIWGCVGLRQWIVVFLTFCAGTQADAPAQAWTILVVGAVINFLGVPAGLIGNELSIRYGLRTIATLVFALSAVAGSLFGFTAMFPYIAVLGLSLIAGFVVQGNFSNLTSGVLAVAAPRYRGATIGLYSCIGFGAGFLGTLLSGVTLDQFGGPRTSPPGCLASALAGSPAWPVPRRPFSCPGTSGNGEFPRQSSQPRFAPRFLRRGGARTGPVSVINQMLPERAERPANHFARKGGGGEHPVRTRPPGSTTER